MTGYKTLYDLQGASRFITGGGSGINFPSIPYMVSGAGHTSHVASTAAIADLTSARAPDNICTNAPKPGWVLSQRQIPPLASPECPAEHLQGQCPTEHLVDGDVVVTG